MVVDWGCIELLLLVVHSKQNVENGQVIYLMLDTTCFRTENTSEAFIVPEMVSKPHETTT